MAKYVRPTLHTKFHIDFTWWQRKEQNFRSYLLSHACPEAEKLLEAYDSNQEFDWINPETGEVFNIDILWYILHAHCAQEPDFITELTPLVTAIFRLYIINDNMPLTPVEIQERLRKKSPELILKTIGGHKVYHGIRPVVVSI